MVFIYAAFCVYVLAGNNSKNVIFFRALDSIDGPSSMSIGLPRH